VPRGAESNNSTKMGIPSWKRSHRTPLSLQCWGGEKEAHRRP
jgi:hypothetical protein